MTSGPQDQSPHAANTHAANTHAASTDTANTDAASTDAASTGAASTGGIVGNLARSCHPIPALAVTVIAGALAVRAGNDAGRAALVTATVFVGQLSIGWSNDAIDAERDRDSHRADKPVAAGAVPLQTVAVAAGVAVILAVALALVLGPRAGGASLLIVIGGWAYNAGLKATWWSWLPYAVAFGALPAVATLARSTHPAPAWWAVVAGALLGVAAHLANVAPDLADDLATGVRGFPHRLGLRGTAVFGPALLAAAGIVIFAGAGQVHDRWRILALAISLLAAGAAAFIATRPDQGRRYFLVTLLAAGVDVALFALSGHRLTA